MSKKLPSHPEYNPIKPIGLKLGKPKETAAGLAGYEAFAEVIWTQCGRLR